MDTRQIVKLTVIAVCLILAVAVAGQIFETVQKGTYQIKQAAITGTMSAKMTPGIWLQFFGDIEVWPKAETFYFTTDTRGGGGRDLSIEVRFNDGSLCNISGTCRIVFPTIESQAVALVTVAGYRSYEDLEQKLILPTIRNALRLTANLMSARESYSEQRTDFNFWAWDQIQNGLYETTEETKKVVDPISGEEVTRTFKIIRREATGIPVYQQNPFEGLGIRLANFEIKEYKYELKVSNQIAAQQEALMAVATARAKAQQAEQEKLTKEAEGKSNVIKAQYEKEEEKIRAVVEAQKEKEVAELQAEQELEVAKLQRQAAELQKEREVLLGQGEAERKRLVMKADGALKQKLETYKQVMKFWADAYAKRQVPQLVMGGAGGSSGTDQSTLDFNAAMQLLVAKQLGLDLNVPGGATAGK